MKRQFNWKQIFNNFPKACATLWQQLIYPGATLDKMILTDFEIKFPHTSEEKLFHFFDDQVILCAVYQNGIGKFVYVAKSEFRVFTCTENPTRHEANLLCAHAAFELLEERINKEQLLQSKQTVKQKVVSGK